MLLVKLAGVNTKPKQLTAAQSASGQHGRYGVVPFAPQRTSIRDSKQPPCLLSGQPVSNPNFNPAYTLHSPDSSGQFRTEEAGISAFKCDTSGGSQAKVNGLTAYCFCSR
jgi:hypothetical protein